MKDLGHDGVPRGKGFTTTIPDTGTSTPADSMDRQFVATRPYPLWVTNITYVAT